MDFRLEENKKTILIIVAAAVLLYVDLAFILKAQLSAYGALKPQITRINSELKTLDTELARARSLEQKAGQKDAEAAKGKKFLQESQLDSLMQDISNAASAHNINIISMQKRPYKETAAVGAKAKPAKFVPYTVNLNLACDFNDLAEFINELENSAVFIAVSSMTVTSGKKDLYSQDASLALKTYVAR